MSKIKTIPKFNSYKEEATFWDTHDFTDYLDVTEPVKMVYEPKDENKEVMTIRVTPTLKKEVKKKAEEYAISPSTLMRMWVVDKLREALKPEDSYMSGKEKDAYKKAKRNT